MTTNRPEDDPGLDGRVAIVSGGGAADDGIGNGRAAAILLARAGTRVLVVDRQLALARAHRQDDHGGGRHRGGPRGRRDGRPRVPRHGAGRRSTASGGSTSSTTTSASAAAAPCVDEAPETWRRVMQVNVETMFLTSRHAIPAMKKTAGRGAIVNVSSISALRPRGLTTYSDVEGRGDRADARDGGGPRARRHPRELRRARPRVHADGLQPRHERERARRPQERLRARHRGHRLGHRPRGALPASRTTRATSRATRWWWTAA